MLGAAPLARPDVHGRARSERAAARGGDQLRPLAAAVRRRARRRSAGTCRASAGTSRSSASCRPASRTRSARPDPTDVWLPNVFRPDERVRGNEFGYRLQVIGRLRDGTSLEQAQAQMDQITARAGRRDAALVHGPRRQGRAAPATTVTRGVRTLDAHAARGGRLRPAHRLREPRQSDARAGQRAQPRAGDPRRARRLALGSRARACWSRACSCRSDGAALGAFAAWLGVEALRPRSRRTCRAPARSRSICACWPRPRWRRSPARCCSALAPMLQFARSGRRERDCRSRARTRPRRSHQWLRGALVTRRSRTRRRAAGRIGIVPGELCPRGRRRPRDRSAATC